LGTISKEGYEKEFSNDFRGFQFGVQFEQIVRRGHHREDAMRAGETEQQMAVRHVAEQEKRIAQQEALIERLRKVGAPSDDALGLLATMQDLLKTMRAHVERLAN
jgi:hypothetical protein